ncbi:endonuclease/exonuclease/phosphatase family protein [bacterium]|nr:endonuclease/exonuclease/phosphatase family protein [bacterium]
MKLKNNNLSLFCWNIANPSIERAEKQADWLAHRLDDDVFILTETKNSRGCLFIEEYFKKNHYNVIFEKPKNNEYGVMIISKHSIMPISFYNSEDNLSSRVASVKIVLNGKSIDIIGIYVPSRDRSPGKIARKKYFIEKVQKALISKKEGTHTILCGDFNILEPNHIPHYSFFEAWEYDFYSFLQNYGLSDSFRHLNPDQKEYSWVGRTGNGYRYDHFFTSRNLLSVIEKCYYFHDTKKEKLSDHSAVILEIKNNR